MDNNNSVSATPSPTAKKGNLRFSYFEPVAGIIFAIVASVIFYFFPQIITIVFIGGTLIPTFDAEVIKSLWLPILLWALFLVAVDVAFLAQRRYTGKLAVIATIGHILVAICTFIIFISPRIVNTDYINFIHTYFADVAVWFGNILARPNLIILVIILIVLIIETINVIKKGLKSRENQEKDAYKNEDEDEEKPEDPA